MQMIHLMPSSVSTQHDQRLVAEVCDIITNIASDAKDKKGMQKAAGDIEAIEKICDLLLSKSLSTELLQ